MGRLQIRPPQCQIKDWIISYIQVPYDNRYFILRRIDNNSNLTYKFSFNEYEKHQDLLLPKELHNIIGSPGGSKARIWDKFLAKVKVYNEYLDKH